MTPLQSLVFGVVSGGGVLLGIFLLLRSRNRGREFPLEDWKSRVEAAERRAYQAEATVKAGLLPHLARLLRANLVTRLLSQRRDLVDLHQEGARRTEALEERLASAHAGLEEKLRRYETQVERLERDTKQPDTRPSPAPPTPAATALPRRNPLLQRPPAAPPPPVRFSEILARKRAGQDTDALRPLTQTGAEKPQNGAEVP